jgi:hypothetical protein
MQISLDSVQTTSNTSVYEANRPHNSKFQQ